MESSYIVLVAQLCPTLCDPIDCSLPGSSLHGILHARILEWVSMPFSRGSLQPRDQPRSPALQADSLSSEPPGKPPGAQFLITTLKMGKPKPQIVLNPIFKAGVLVKVPPLLY